MRPSIRTVFVVALAASSALFVACRGQASEDPPILLLRNMYHQQRYNPQGTSAQFSDHRAMRTPPEGTVAREFYFDDDRISTGRELDNSAYVLRIPDEVTRHWGGGDSLVSRGRERYNIYCSPCHGRAGDGQGMVLLRSRTSGYQYPPPPSFHDERLRHIPDGQLFATITNGVRNMPSYAAQIPVYDRWAIVAYVRALQLSQATRTGAAQ